MRNVAQLVVLLEAGPSTKAGVAGPALEPRLLELAPGR